MRLWHRTRQHLRTATGSARSRRWSGVAMMSASLVLLACLSWDAAAQRRQRATPLPSSSPPAVIAPPPTAGAGTVAGASVELPPERVQADVSARRIAVTSSFAGTEVVVFGAVDNSRQLSPEAGLYDIVIVVEGAPTRLVARRKSLVAGVWINTSSITFDSVPSFYAIASTRPLDEIGADNVLKKQEIGFQHARMKLAPGSEALTPDELKQWREAVVRLKRKDKLYVAEDYSVVFIGRSLFRATFDLPANVTVGLFDTRVYLFRGGELLHSYTARLDLEREGLELWLHAFAFKQPLLYGILTVLMAVGAGLLASTLFSRASH